MDYTHVGKACSQVCACVLCILARADGRKQLTPVCFGIFKPIEVSMMDPSTPVERGAIDAFFHLRLGFPWDAHVGPFLLTL